MNGPPLNLSAIKLALMAQEARTQAQAFINADPIAIVGMACRAPGGVDTPEALWRLVLDGIDATQEVPPDRWDSERWFDPDPGVPGKVMVKRGGFLADVGQFDADYFGILPREAELMDPQQRLALETAIEAIDDAGVPHQKLKGSRTGVFIACYHDDYARLAYGDVDAIDLRTLTGTLPSIVSSRISYFLDLRGPSLTLDSACSASLAAVHLACQSLRSGEADFALAGGVSIMLSPELMVAMSKVGFMAPDGRCKTFDARANGFGRGEGCGIVALKRLSDAVAGRDRVIAVIRGSAFNQDGRSTVLTAPNGLAQESLVREALSNGGVAPERVVYVETHGTGTALGDPIEVDALTAALAAPGAPVCRLGSIKANIGHLEAAAGVIGLIKAALVLRHGEIPPQPNFERLNPHIQIAGTRMEIATARSALSIASACAGVSSFGVGGANAHVVIEQAPDLGTPSATKGMVWTLPLSAKTEDGLRALGQQWLDLLENAQTKPSMADLCRTASQRRTHYPARLAVVGQTQAELHDQLRSALNNVGGRVYAERPKIGFIYSGQGPQWPGMGCDLAVREPVFAAALEACDAAIQAAAGWSVIEEIGRCESESRLAATEIAQPALFALQVALTALWRHWGVKADAVMGHSVGEIAALHAAGALTLEEAARVVTLRGRIMQGATASGRMAAAPLTESEGRALVGMFEGDLDIAAVNAPRSVVLSGRPAALEAAVALLTERGIEARALSVDYAFHSPQMTPLADRFASELGQLDWRTPHTAVYSTLTGQLAPKQGFSSGDIAQAVRAPVRFADAIAAMAKDVQAFVELGPHPVLGAAIAATLDAHPPRVLAASLRRGRDGSQTMREACAQMYVAGVDPDWVALQHGEGTVVSLPAYPWRRRRHWVRGTAAPETRARPQWIGAATPIADREEWIVPLQAAAIVHWLDDHRIFGRRLVPGAAIMQAMTRAARQVAGREVDLSDFEITSPLTAPADAEMHWQIVVAEKPDSAWRISLHASDASGRPGATSWRTIARAVVSEVVPAPRIEPDVRQSVDVEAAYARFQALGAQLGPGFKLLSDVRIGTDSASGWVETEEDFDGIHPALIDAGIQLACILDGSRNLYLPLSVDHICISDAWASRVRAKALLVGRQSRTITADIVLESEDGAVVAALKGLHLAVATANALAPAAPDILVMSWTPVALEPDASARTWAVLGNGPQGCDLRDARDTNLIAVSTPMELPAGAALLVAPEAGFGAAELAALVNAIPDNVPREVAVVTRGAMSVREDEGAEANAAALWGLCGVAALERVELKIRLVDLDPQRQVSGAELLAVLERCAEPRLALRDGAVLAPRLSKLAPSSVSPKQQRLTVASEGFDAVMLKSFDPGVPRAGEVKIKVSASGVNFRDTLIVLGMYEGKPAPLGAECAGTVEAIGPGVSGFAIGDRVFGLGQACHATHAIARADLIAKTPRRLSDADAAALPIGFLTADIGLRLGVLKGGDRILIHAASGGVGLAAVALAQQIGAEIHATAGTEQKRSLLRRIGVRYVYDSRSLAYADQILELTGGEGVRVALNSLTGAFVGATLRTLATGGVLLEMGKRAIWTPDQVAAARPDVAYHVFDAGEITYANPENWARFAREILPAIERGELARQPIRVWPLARAADAFRWMAQARHVGKLVLQPSARIAPVSEATYLVTGGLGGLGLFAAEWLAARGARHLLLVGRSEPSAEADVRIAALRANGVEVRVGHADASDATAMRGLIDAPGSLPLRGIVHAAGVAPDAPLHATTANEFAVAREGKVEGAKTLRALLHNSPLDFFILCSTAGVVLGSPGQAAYAAANAELDALASQWRCEGLRTLSVAWAAWAEAGMFARMQERAQAAWSKRGLSAFTAAQAFAALDSVMEHDLSYAVVATVDWGRFFANAPTGLALEQFQAFAPRAARAPKIGAAHDVVRKIRALPQARRREEVEDLVHGRVRELIGLPSGQKLGAQTPLKDAGLDSLMAVELRNGLARLGNRPLPVTLAFDCPTISAIAERLAEVWSLGRLEPDQLAAPRAHSVRDEDLAMMSDADADALLRAELQELATARQT